MNVEPSVLLRFIQSIDPPTEVRLIDVNGRATVIPTSVVELPDLSVPLEACRWVQVGDGPTMLFYVFEDIIGKFEGRKSASA
jgi:hypothetical protein